MSSIRVDDPKYITRRASTVYTFGLRATTGWTSCKIIGVSTT